MLASENIRYVALGLDIKDALDPNTAFLMADELTRIATEVEALEEIARTVAHHHGIPPEILGIAALLHRDGVSAGLPRREGAA